MIHIIFAKGIAEKFFEKKLLEIILNGAFTEEPIDAFVRICYNIRSRTEETQVTVMQTFKIFYSWQSDLPGNKTRNFIRECIDRAINLAQESETIEAERDEATLGVTGSPDIVATLFSKIENCDLFIIASTSGHGYYEFDVANLRPNECKWLSGGMLIKPIDGKIKVHYQIHSDRSTGDLGGTLELYSD